MFFLKRFCISIFCFVLALSSNAQEKNKAIVLKKILQTIEKQHNVYFNYIDNEIASIKIIPPKKSLTFNEKLNYLQKNTNLFFENIDNQYINVFDSNRKLQKKICGFVFSKIDNTPLESANVQSINGSSTTTNTNGYFEFINIDATEISISYVGFVTQKIASLDFQNKNCPKIFLEIETAELTDVKTFHYLTSGISKSSNGTFQIKPKKLGILPGLIEADVLQLMQQIPGVNSADESVASINVRGGTHDQNLFLWNGIKMYQTGHFFGLISVFNPNLGSTVTIAKNGSSAFYGESVSSVVDISSNTTKFEKDNFSAGVNLINADVYSKINFNKISFLEIAGRKSIPDVIKTPTYQKYHNKAFQNTSVTNSFGNKDVIFSSQENFNFYDLTLKYSQEIGKKNYFLLDLITINDELKVFQSSINNNIIATENNILYQKNYGGNITFKHNWNKNNTSTANAYTSSYELDADKNKIEANIIVKQENMVLDNGYKLENNHIISPKFVFNNGYQFNEIGITNLDEVNSPSFSRKVRKVLKTHALILEGKYNDTVSKLYFSAGMRVNYIDQFKKYLLEPRLQLNYGIAKNWNLEILGEFKSQNCSQIIDLQNDYFGIEKRRWVLANNSTIPIQKSKQASVSLSFSKNHWLLSIENFYKTVNGISSSSQGFQNQLEFSKINGSYEVFGTEILLQKKINRFITWISYTYNDNNYSFSDFQQAAFSNNFELDHIVNWAGIYEKENLKIAFGAKWYSGRPETTPLTTEINNSVISNPTIDYNLPNNEHLEPFFQVNFSTTYKWKNNNGIQYKLGISVLNVLNKHNEIKEYYKINTASNTIDDVKTYALERTPNLSFRASF